jgi:pimeloyl-ACP methyl ester carboxylesterase
MEKIRLLASWLLTVGMAADPIAAQMEIGAPPGQLVSVDGRALHVLCSGSGAPAVLLEAGASSFAIDWTLVQREIATSTRVCSYDRAWHGWSDPAPGPFGATVVPDLAAILDSLAIDLPVVLVGASAGGLYVREYQARHPEDVAGMVLIDPASEDRLFTMLDGRPVLIADLTEEEILRSVPPRDVPVPRRQAQTGAPFDRLPPDLYRARVALETNLIAAIPDTVPYATVLASVQLDRARLSALHQARAERPTVLDDLPLIVLTRGVDSSRDLLDSHARLAALSTNARHSVVQGAGHEIHLYQPEAVVDAIRAVVEAVRGGSRLAGR